MGKDQTFIISGQTYQIKEKAHLFQVYVGDCCVGAYVTHERAVTGLHAEIKHRLSNRVWSYKHELELIEVDLSHIVDTTPEQFVKQYERLSN